MKLEYFIQNCITGRHGNGSIWIEKKDLEEKAGFSRISLAALPGLIERGIIISYSPEGTGRTYYTTPKLDKMETEIAGHIIRIMENYTAPMVSQENIDRYIEKAEAKFGKTLHEEQRNAVNMALQSGFCVITGGPGTGKTCVLQTLTYVLKQLNKYVDIRFTAPTGKAARRIEESTGSLAKTTQMELGLAPGNYHRRYFGGDVLIVDEVSMLDMETTYEVLRAIKSGDKMIFVGDIEQLPSVGPGAVLRDLIFSGVVPVTMLAKTFRQAEDSNIFGNIKRIINKEPDFSEGDDFVVVDAGADGADPMDQLVALYLQEREKYGADNVVCLLPYRKSGDLCSDRFNNIIQDIVNPVGDRPYLTVTSDKGLKIKLSSGDPVMQLENREEVANGDVGYVVACSANSLTVSYPQYDDLQVVYDKTTAKDLSLAYAMSIHKSQGSEYKSVVMGITNAHAAMLNKNILYTGVTRAKERCVLLRDEEAIITALHKESEYDRNTFLAEKINQCYMGSGCSHHAA